jgi:TM2 domain-containing membrane protein YozV
VTETQPPPPPGWYPENGTLRYWDGANWTENRAPIAPATPVVFQSPPRSVGLAYVFLLLLGGFAAHHFYLSRWVAATVLLILWWGGWLLTFVGIGYAMLFVAGIWLITDLFMLPGYVNAFNRDELDRLAAEQEERGREFIR